MRKLLTVALLLYNVVALAMKSGNYDYDDVDGNKRHSSLANDRRNWRKKALQKPLEEHNEWDKQRRDGYDNQRYIDEQDPKVFNTVEKPRDRDFEVPGPLNSYPTSTGNRHYNGDNNANNLQPNFRSSEREYNMEKDMDKKPSINCERQHERYEACFAGCASVTCDNPRERLRPCYPFCESGCICTPPYVRDDRTHKCVLPEDCSKGLKGVPDLGDDI